MTLEAFKATLDQPAPPELSPLLRALWYDARGDWEGAHDIAQEVHSNDGSWVHAYLHRKEGDDWNAGYWYRRAGRTMPDQSLEEEWAFLVGAFLENQ